MRDEQTGPPYFSIIIPVRDEERVLPRCLQRLDECQAFNVSRGLKKPCEIVVVINRCTDRSEAIAAEHGCVIVRCDEKNLSAIRNAGVQAAKGEVILTLDADSLASTNLLYEVWRVMDGSSGATDVDNRKTTSVGGGVFIFTERYSLGIVLTALLVWVVLLWKRVSVGAIFCRRPDFWAIGGFDVTQHSAEDIHFAERLRAYGLTRGQRYRTIMRASITTSCRKFDKFGDWFFLKNLFHTFRLLRGGDQASADRIWYDFPRE